MINKIITTGAIMILASAAALAQDLTAFGQNYINRFSAAPAFAGFNGNSEGFIGYRTVMAGIDGAPKVLRADANGNINGNMGYGVEISNEKHGNFSNTFAAITYAYHLDLGGDAHLSLALSPALVRSAYNLGGAKTFGANADPVFQNEAGMSATGFDAGFSVMFNMQNLFVSVNAPRLICPELKYQNGLYNYDRAINGQVSYVVEADKWEIEPIANVGYQMQNGLEWMAMVAAKYNRKAWLTASYSSQQWIGIGAGFAASNRVAVNYQYELGTSDIAKNCNGTHEISVGFLISKGKEYKRPTVFADDPEAKPSQKKDQNMEKKMMDEIKRLEEKINSMNASNAGNATPAPDENPATEPENIVDDSNMKPEAPEEIPDKKSWEAPMGIPNVRFGYGSAKLFASSNPGIDRLIEILKTQGDRIMLIAVHTDGAGSRKYSKQLAEKRAEAIKAYIVSKGISGDRIQTFGFKEKKRSALDPTESFQSNYAEYYLSTKK